MIRFDLNADLSSLFHWNTKQVFVYVSASWPNATGAAEEPTNEAVIWDAIITNPSADHLVNLGPAAKKKLVRSAKGKKIDPSRYVPHTQPCFTLRLLGGSRQDLAGTWALDELN